MWHSWGQIKALSSIWRVLASTLSKKGSHRRIFRGRVVWSGLSLKESLCWEWTVGVKFRRVQQGEQLGDYYNNSNSRWALPEGSSPRYLHSVPLISSLVHIIRTFFTDYTMQIAVLPPSFLFFHNSACFFHITNHYLAYWGFFYLLIIISFH